MLKDIFESKSGRAIVGGIVAVASLTGIFSKMVFREPMGQHIPPHGYDFDISEEIDQACLDRIEAGTGPAIASLDRRVPGDKNLWRNFAIFGALNDITLCEQDLPGDYGAIFSEEHQALILDTTTKHGTDISQAIYALMHGIQARNGDLRYSLNWNLADRQAHAYAVEATGVTAELLIAYEHKTQGDDDHAWRALAKDPSRRAAMEALDRVYNERMERGGPPGYSDVSGDVLRNTALIEAGRVAWAELVRDPVFQERVNDWTLNIYFAELMEGDLHGAGKSGFDISQEHDMGVLVDKVTPVTIIPYTDSDFTIPWIEAKPMAAFKPVNAWAEKAWFSFGVASPYDDDTEMIDYAYNAYKGWGQLPITGSGPVPATQNRFIADRDTEKIYEAVELYRIVQAEGEDNALAKLRLSEATKRGNPYINLDMEEVYEKYEASDYERPVADIMREMAGVVYSPGGPGPTAKAPAKSAVPRPA